LHPKRTRTSSRARPRLRHAASRRVVNDAARILDKAIEVRPISELNPNPRNARTHGDQQIGQIAASIAEFGFTVPVLVDENNTILAGHGRVEAAKLLGMTEVPTLRLDHLTAADKRAYVIADNRLAELAGWDRETLRIELETLVDLDFDVELTGFTTGEVDLLIEGVGANPEPDPADQLPATAGVPVVSRPGDLWRLGRHLLLCGDALLRESYQRLLGKEAAQMVFIDPPYNVPIDGFVGGKGRVRHDEFVMASGEMTPAQYTAFLSGAFRLLAAHSVRGSVHFVCIDWRHVPELGAAAAPVYTRQLNLCVWVKTNAGMGSSYRSRHELVFVFKSGAGKPINNVNLGVTGRYRTNVWSYPGINALGHGRDELLALHPTVKPVALVADALRDASRRNGVVLDAFAGSGTTIIAAERTGRIARAIELDPRYVDVAVRRWEAFTGQAACHAETAATFAATSRERAQPEPEAPPASPRTRHRRPTP